jgi:hypothetical protein
MSCLAKIVEKDLFWNYSYCLEIAITTKNYELFGKDY